MAIAPADQAEHRPGALAEARSDSAHRVRGPAFIHQPVGLFEDGSVQEVRTADIVTGEPDNAVGLDPFGGVMDAPPASFRGFLLVEEAICRGRLSVSGKGLADELGEELLLRYRHQRR